MTTISGLYKTAERDGCNIRNSARTKPGPIRGFNYARIVKLVLLFCSTGLKLGTKARINSIVIHILYETLASCLVITR